MDWIKPGQEVVVHNSGVGIRYTQVEITTIERIGKRDVILANGERFNRNHQSWDGGGLLRISYERGGGWGSTPQLHPIDHPVAQKALKSSRQEATISRVLAIAEKWSRSKDDDYAQEILDSLRAYMTEDREVDPLSKGS